MIKLIGNHGTKAFWYHRMINRKRWKLWKIVKPFLPTWTVLREKCVVLSKLNAVKILESLFCYQNERWDNSQRVKDSTDDGQSASGGRGLMQVSKAKVSDLIHHQMPSTHWAGNSSLWKSSLLNSMEHSDSEMNWRTFRLLLTHFVSLATL